VPSRAPGPDRYRLRLPRLFRTCHKLTVTLSGLTPFPPQMDGTQFQVKYLDEDPVIVWWSQNEAEWKSDNHAVPQPSKSRPIPE
jgi:hypothetical protein